MTFTPSFPSPSSAWEQLRQSLSAYLPERRIERPEISPEQRAIRIAAERLMLERSNSTLLTSRWPR